MRTLHVANFLNPDLLNNHASNDDDAYVHHMADVAGQSPTDIALLLTNSLSASPAPPNDPSGNQDNLPGSHDSSRAPSTQPPSAATAEVPSETPLSSEGQHQVQQAQMAIQSLLGSINRNSKQSSGLIAPGWRSIMTPHSPDPPRAKDNKVRSSRSLPRTYKSDACSALRE